MTYRVQFFDTDGKLICWYTTKNKFEAERIMEYPIKDVVMQMEEVAYA